jgi:hypothetical protein
MRPKVIDLHHILSSLSSHDAHKSHNACTGSEEGAQGLHLARESAEIFGHKHFVDRVGAVEENVPFRETHLAHGYHLDVDNGSKEAEEATQSDCVRSLVFVCVRTLPRYQQRDPRPCTSVRRTDRRCRRGLARACLGCNLM